MKRPPTRPRPPELQLASAPCRQRLNKPNSQSVPALEPSAAVVVLVRPRRPSLTPHLGSLAGQRRVQGCAVRPRTRTLLDRHPARPLGRHLPAQPRRRPPAPQQLARRRKGRLDRSCAPRRPLAKGPLPPRHRPKAARPPRTRASRFVHLPPSRPLSSSTRADPALPPARRLRGGQASRRRRRCRQGARPPCPAARRHKGRQAGAAQVQRDDQGAPLAALSSPPCSLTDPRLLHSRNLHPQPTRRQSRRRPRPSVCAPLSHLLLPLLLPPRLRPPSQPSMAS